MRGKVLEAKFQEDKLRMQQKHDNTVQKVETDVLDAADVFGYKPSSLGQLM